MSEEKDVVQEMDVVLQMKVEDVNTLLSLLSELPYNKVAKVIHIIREDTMKQVQEQLNAKKETKD